ncbi:ovalbumin-like [Ornithodoros turicata]|uniref:ovalbumin-like n=1 Tax=Ornithodoros turicata TaxID=34597 RepID=UPI003139EE36
MTAVGDSGYEALTQFGLTLFSSLAGERSGQTTLVSPAAIGAQLCALQTAACGDTKTEFLGAPLREGLALHLHAVTVKLFMQLEKPNPYVSMSLVQRMFVDKAAHLNESWTKLVESKYRCGVEQVSFRADPEAVAALANSWVLKATQGRVDCVIPPGTIDSSAKIVMVSAFYFKGYFDHPFKAIGKKTFLAKISAPSEVDMIGATGEFLYAELNAPAAAKVIELPYRNKDITLLLFLPDSHLSLQEYRTALTPQMLTDIIGKLERKQVYVELPVMTLTQEVILNRSLVKTGVKHAFMDGADFTVAAPSGGLRLTDVLHRATFVLAESPDATATQPLSPAPLEFLLCRPFLFVLQRARDRYILLLGAVKSIPVAATSNQAATTSQ